MRTASPDRSQYRPLPAWSGNRNIGANGKLPPVGNTVDVKTATYTNAISEPQLTGSWTDPDFKAGERAFYYARVI